MAKVALDAGHFHSHPGAVSAGVREVDINHAVILALNDRLVRQGVETFEVVSSDRNQKRAAYQKVYQANAFKANFYVSVHVNSSLNKLAHGVEVFHYPGSRKGKMVARAVLDRVSTDFSMKSRGIKEGKFIVLRHSLMPAVLLEWGFITNPAERYLITQQANIERCGDSIASAVFWYLGITPK